MTRPSRRTVGERVQHAGGKRDDFVHGDHVSISAFKRVAADKLAQCFSDHMKKQSDSDVKVKNVSWGRLGFPHLGERSAAYQIAVDLETHGLTPTAYFDIVFIQRKRALSVLMFADILSPFDESLKERLSRAVVQRTKE